MKPMFQKLIQTVLGSPVSKRKKKICFVVSNSWGSHIMLGFQLSDQLRKMGIDTAVLDILKEPKAIKTIKNSIVIFVKETVGSHHKIIKRLKKNGNLLIWNPSDGFDSMKSDSGIQMMHGVLMPNKRCKKDWAQYLNNNVASDVLYLHWDPRCQFNQAQNFGLAYTGMCLPDNISQEQIDQVKDLNIVSINTKDAKKNLSIFEAVLEYNCHFSVRNSESDTFKYKPNSKMSFASATNSNIVMSRDPSNIELMDASYPYFTSNNIGEVIQKVQYAKETYGSEEWNLALSMMADIRERTSIQRICQDLLTIISNF